MSVAFILVSIVLAAQLAVAGLLLIEFARLRHLTRALQGTTEDFRKELRAIAADRSSLRPPATVRSGRITTVIGRDGSVRFVNPGKQH